VPDQNEEVPGKKIELRHKQEISAEETETKPRSGKIHKGEDMETGKTNHVDTAPKES
jgi:hypothetical protein